MALEGSFADRFAELTGHLPYPWQARLHDDWFLKGRIPATCDLPTGLGKTSVMAIWFLAARAGARLPRRLVYVVDRRVVVDQATAEAEKIRARHLGLAISTLRGRHADNKDWLEDPSAPGIIVGTVDMIGSRLLFSGYGVSSKMRPYHAGLLGADTLVVVDESHLVPPFEELLATIAAGEGLAPRAPADRAVIPPLRLMALSATGRRPAGEAFRLGEDDRADERVRRRLEASKRATAVAAGDRGLAGALAEEAWGLAVAAGRPIRCLVYCDSREVAEAVSADLSKRGKNEVETELLVGARRVRERADAAARLRSLGFLADGDAAPPMTAFLIATSAGEVGIDIDADHMVCDLVPWERMVQRLGRVNRRGSGDARVIIVHGGEPAPDDGRAAVAWRGLALLARLPADGRGHDASPAALARLRSDHGEEVAAATSPEPLRPALTRALVDAWAMTSLDAHPGRPEVEPWLRGWIDQEPQTTVVWRARLPVRTRGGQASSQEVDAFFEAAPPHLAEGLETETHRVVKWLMARAKRLAGKATGVDDKAPPLALESIAAFVLDAAGGLAATLRLEEVVAGTDAGRLRDRLQRGLAGATLVVDARLGGLGAAGLLAETAEGAPAADGDDGWPEVGFRMRVVSAEEAIAGGRAKPFAFALERNDEGEDLRLLLVEKVEGASASEDGRALARRPQLLADHRSRVAVRAGALATALGVGPDLAGALDRAAMLHDEGKRTRHWQRAFNAPADGIYAKTRGPVRGLGGYRHEFGSLVHAGKDAALAGLPAGMGDLALHLIAAHHGRARPTIAIEGCEEAPPSLLAAHAREAALRFDRLGRRWGPWGLAWLEALLRAADQQASRENDEEGVGDGRG